MRKRKVEQSLGIYFKHVCFLKKSELEVMPRIRSVLQKLETSRCEVFKKEKWILDGKMSFWREEEC